MTLRPFGFLVVLALIAACHPAVPPVPSRGGPAWRELTSEHFVVWTDASPEDGATLVREMEHLRQVVFGVAFPTTVSATKCLVIAFRDADEVHGYIADQFAATTFGADNALLQPAIVIAADTPDGERSVIAHELTHLISFTVLPEQPHWFAEGLATYFESVKLDTATAEIGTPLPLRVKWVRSAGLVPMARVFACQVPACLDGPYYATVGALFNFLANERGQELVRYMEIISQLPHALLDAAWAQAFPDLPPATLDHELAHWVAYGRHAIRTYKVALRDVPIATRPLADADVYATRAFVEQLTHPRTPPPDLAAALAADPTNVVAQMVATRDTPLTPDAARAVATAHPDDWRAWWLVLRTSPHDHPREALAKLCATLPAGSTILSANLCAPR